MKLALLLLALPAVALAASPTYFVSPQGNDAWSGTLPDPNGDGSDGPVANVYRAQELLRTHATEQGLPEGGTVYLRGGTYYLSHPIFISSFESGTGQSPMLWQAYKFEPVTLVAGTPVTEWTPGKDNSVTATIPGMEPVMQLLLDGKRMPLARWPDRSTENNPLSSYALIDRVAEDGASFSLLSQAALPKISNESQGLWSPLGPVSSLDPGNRRVTLAEPPRFAPRRGERFFLENARQFLSAPGEWYFDPDGRTLEFLRPGAGEAVACTVSGHFKVENAQHVAILGLRLLGAAEDAVELVNASDCLIARNTIAFAGGVGVKVEGGHGNRIAGNDFSDSGRSAVVVSGGTLETLEAAHHVVANNRVERSGGLRRPSSAVVARGVGHTISNNLIFDTPGPGIEIDGNDMVVELNQVHDVCQEDAETGAIVLSGSWTKRGNIIRDNVIHDVYGLGLLSGGEPITYARPFMAWGIYLDQAASGATIARNLIYRVPLGGVVIAGGRDNAVVNNVIVDCVPALHIDARWAGFDWAGLEEERSTRLGAGAVYAGRYPALADMPNPRSPANNLFAKNVVTYLMDEYRGPATRMNSPEAAVVYTLDRFDEKTCRFEKNVIHHYGPPVRVLWHDENAGGKILHWEDWQRAGFDQDSLAADPLFLTPSEDDYLLLKESPALGLGIRRLSTVAAGLYQDEFRASWPPPEVKPRSLPQHEVFGLP